MTDNMDNHLWMRKGEAPVVSEACREEILRKQHSKTYLLTRTGENLLFENCLTHNFL